MMGLYQKKYRIESARLKEYDYSSSGAYFVTVCTKNHETLFGNVIDGHMVLSEIGEFVKKEWEKSFEIRSEMSGDEYVIMPNHMHGIVVIDNDCFVETHGSASHDDSTDQSSQSMPHEHGPEIHSRSFGDAHHMNRDARRASLHNQFTSHGVAVRTPGSLSSFMAGFKSAVTRRINENLKTPNRSIWQSRFFERIIRNDDEMNRIRQYILNNPAKWLEDKYNC